MNYFEQDELRRKYEELKEKYQQGIITLKEYDKTILETPKMFELIMADLKNTHQIELNKKDAIIRSEKERSNSLQDKILKTNTSNEYTEDPTPNSKPEITPADEKKLYTQFMGHWEYYHKKNKLEFVKDNIPNHKLLELWEACGRRVENLEKYIELCIEQKVKFKSNKTAYDYIYEWRYFITCFKEQRSTKDQEEYENRDNKGVAPLLRAQRELHDSKLRDRRKRSPNLVGALLESNFGGSEFERSEHMEGDPVSYPLVENEKPKKLQTDREFRCRKLIRIWRRMFGKDPSHLEMHSTDIYLLNAGITSVDEIRLYITKNYFDPTATTPKPWRLNKWQDRIYYNKYGEEKEIQLNMGMYHSKDIGIHGDNQEHLYQS